MSHDNNYGLAYAAYEQPSQPMDYDQEVNGVQAARQNNPAGVEFEVSDVTEPPFYVKEARQPQSTGSKDELPIRNTPRRRVSVKPTVDPISDHSTTGAGRDQNQPRYDIIEKTHRITTDDEGNTTAEETIVRQVSVGRNEQGEQFMIEKEATMQHPVGAEDMYGDMSIPAGPRYQYQPRNVYIPVGRDDTADERQPIMRDPRPMIYRHGRSDSPPYLSEMYDYPNIPMPAMYSSVPVRSTSTSKRAAKKGREQTDVYTMVSDDEYERYAYQSNVKRDQDLSVGREVRQDKKKHRALISPPKKTWKDAAHSCAIEVDDDGCLLNVLLTDDLVGSDLRFGRQQIMFHPEADNIALGPPPQLTNKKRPRSYKVGMRYNAPQLVEIGPIHNTDILRGKMVKVKRRRLKGKRHTQDIIRVPAAHDVITRHEVNPYTDSVTMDLQSLVPGRTLGPGLFSANAVYMVPEELTDEVPIGIQAFARDRIARWTEDSSSEESDEELPPVKPPRSIADRGVLTEAEWRFRLEEEDSRRQATIQQANQDDMQRLRAIDPRIQYIGGQPIYMQRTSATGKQTIIPDMYPYAMPTEQVRAEERRRASQPYSPDNQYY